MENSLHHKAYKNSYNILLVEDNLLLANAIEVIINQLNQKESLPKFNIEMVLDYESAIDKIENASETGYLDVIILDINLGKSKNGQRRSGEELGPLIRKHIQNAKIIVFTSYSDGLKINSILKNLNPDGFLIKDRTTDDVLLQKVIVKIIEGGTYYCDAVVDVLRKKYKMREKLDAIDLKLLYELSIATKIKDMPNYISLTISGIEKRRRRLKEIFEVESDRSLVIRAKEIGFL